MTTYDQLLRDIDADNPDYAYHQDYRDEDLVPRKLLQVAVPVVLLIIAAIYTFLHTLDYKLLSLPEMLWNWLVYMTPEKLVDYLDNDIHLAAAIDPARSNLSRTHVAKSETMRRILGLDTSGSIMGTVAQASRRRLSSLSSLNMLSHPDDGRPAGLGNWDNSCYQNSVLQGLASLDNFSNYLVDPGLPESVEVTENPDMKMADSLRGLIARLKDPENNGKRIWTPAVLKSMSSWQQQDAQEYFSKVLDEIDKEVEKAAAQIKPSETLAAEGKAEIAARKGLDPVAEPMGISNIRNPLEGLLAQRVGCTRCGYSEGLSMIPFNCLTVPLGRAGAWSYNISDCLHEYTKLEAIEGVECGKCTLQKTQRLLNVMIDRIKDAPENEAKTSIANRLQVVEEALEEDDYDEKTLSQKCKISPKNRTTTTKSRQAVIARPPRSLAVHINRSLFDEMTGELKKNYAEVRFPKILDLGPWCLGSSSRESDGDFEEWGLDPQVSMIAGKSTKSRIHGPLYELRAVVTHYGRHENGHYIAYRKHPVIDVSDEKGLLKEQWWRLSDDDVSRVTEDNVLGQGGVFMLFYDLVQQSSLVKAETSVTSVEEAVVPKQTAVRSNSSLSASSVETPPDAEVANEEQIVDPLVAADKVTKDSKACQSSARPRTPKQVELRILEEPGDQEDTINESAISNPIISDADTFNNMPNWREGSVATTISEDDSPPPSEDYQLTKPIHIAPFVQTSGAYKHKGEQNQGVQGATGSMVMV
jgi:ubiquitin carboxyl-terminal hydrolase 1